MALNDDYCPTHPDCPECGTRRCLECGDNVLQDINLCVDCAELHAQERAS